MLLQDVLKKFPKFQNLFRENFELENKQREKFKLISIIIIA